MAAHDDGGGIQWRSHFTHLLGSLVLVVIVLVVIRYWFYDGYTVRGENMDPALELGDDYLVRTDGKATRGDVVVVEGPEDRLILTRVIAVGGDLLDFVDGAVHLNGAPLAEPYLPDGTVTSPPENGATTVTVPVDTVYVMGDNRGASSDSRQFGPLPAAGVEGRVVGVGWWPFD